MTLAYFDCFNGAGGDMIVGSLIDAGADAEALVAGLRALNVDGYQLSIQKVKKQGFAATRFDVQLDPAHKHGHRHLHHIRTILDHSTLPERVRARAIQVFEKLAAAEAKVHGSTIEKVHFHEVGAVDAIVDIVGAALALDLLKVDRVVCSPIPTGSGTVTCEHGVMPVPAPGTAELLKNVPLMATDETGELTTPTAAAIFTTIAQSYGPLPAMSVQRIGYGAGSRDGKTRPNVLRVLIGEGAESGYADTDQVMVLETNLDDATPQAIGHCVERLLQEGAWDAFTMPIQMKKCRPGTLLTVLCEPGRQAVCEQIIFSETPTLGIRRHLAARTILRRTMETVETRFGAIRMKVVVRPNGERTASAEYEDCKAAAEKSRVALAEVMKAAQDAWYKCGPVSNQ